MQRCILKTVLFNLIRPVFIHNIKSTLIKVLIFMLINLSLQMIQVSKYLKNLINAVE